MAAAERKHYTKCPFWLAASMQCGICNGGLCIPMDDHAEVYCKTPLFSACMQYTLHSEKQIYLLKKIRKSEENRRKYLRIETSQDITLVKIFKSGKLVSHFSFNAKTIDVSKGGVRMVTKKPLVHDTMVQFFFDAPLPQALHQIIGQVEWCNKRAEKPGYQAGVSFLGDHIIEAMGRYLGQQQK